ncbi:hypothetical protein cyc_03658 [Cyclospora cayetanensis]|uniref:Uncharacterized protein n=1 Tax=Cyclospora cayetanensis TaxID=88456 RepID=A0A1D3D0N9_9EIME|nr:hypothetical protein cyc_03658 [Cyclospora cayetanensis]
MLLPFTSLLHAPALPFYRRLLALSLPLCPLHNGPSAAAQRYLLLQGRSWEDCAAHFAAMEREAETMRRALLIFASWFASSTHSGCSAYTWIQTHLLRLYAAIRSGLCATSWPSVSPELSLQQRQQQLHELREQPALLLLDAAPRVVGLPASGGAVCAANLTLLHRHLSRCLQHTWEGRDGSGGCSASVEQLANEVETACAFLLQQLQRVFQISHTDYAHHPLSHRDALGDRQGARGPSEGPVLGAPRRGPPLPSDSGVLDEAEEASLPCLTRLFLLYRHPQKAATLVQGMCGALPEGAPTARALGGGPPGRRVCVGRTLTEAHLGRAAGGALSPVEARDTRKGLKGRRQKPLLPAPLLSAAFRSNVATAALLREVSAAGRAEAPLLAAAAAAAEDAAASLALSVWGGHAEGAAAALTRAPAPTAAIEAEVDVASSSATGVREEAQSEELSAPAAACAAGAKSSSSKAASRERALRTARSVEQAGSGLTPETQSRLPRGAAANQGSPGAPFEQRGALGSRGGVAVRRLRGRLPRTRALLEENLPCAVGEASLVSETGAEAVALDSGSSEEWVEPPPRRKKKRVQKALKRPPGRPPRQGASRQQLQRAAASGPAPQPATRQTAAESAAASGASIGRPPVDYSGVMHTRSCVTPPDTLAADLEAPPAAQAESEAPSAPRAASSASQAASEAVEPSRVGADAFPGLFVGEEEARGMRGVHWTVGFPVRDSRGAFYAKDTALALVQRASGHLGSSNSRGG